MTRISKKFIVIVSAAILTIAVVAVGVTYWTERSAEQMQAELIAEEMKWFQETLRTARGHFVCAGIGYLPLAQGAVGMVTE